MFCSKCSSLLMPVDGTMQCPACKTVQGDGKIAERKKKQKEIAVVQDGKTEHLPTVKADCKKCGNTEAYFWMLQTRGADEPETRFFKCTKCEYTWREY
ncbi:transcription factor S [Candidatus Woesearchaeota archaeon]|nr:transcription factor S [Candidatus Woesearchaeota archaeon]